MLGHLLPVFMLVGGSAAAQEPLGLRDGDRVAMIGNTFVEREQREGFVELALTLAAAEGDVAFRNLGWSGDTVDGRARRFFGSTEEGFQHLLTHLDVVKPTVILVSYGTNEAFDGAAGRAAFIEGYGKLLDELQKRTKRIVLVTSPPLDPSVSPAPELANEVNAELSWQAERLAVLAQKRGLRFVDLFTPLVRLIETGDAPAPLTDNGMHLTSLGYRLAARIIVRQLGLGSGAVSADLPAATAALSAAREDLRRRIIEKNEVFFHRHRPQNETYLRGFRKHEQGNNATEIYAFDPLVVEKDREIFALRAAAIEG